jgi:hypothetical protein
MDGAMGKADDDDTPEQPGRHFSRAPAPIRPVVGRVRAAPPPRPFVPAAPVGLVTFAQVPETLAANAEVWAIPPERLPVSTTALEAYAQPIAHHLATTDTQAAGINARDGSMMWAPRATWRKPVIMRGSQTSSVIAAMHCQTISFIGRFGSFDCYPVLLGRDLALIFGAEKPPEAAPQWVLDDIRDILRPTPRPAGPSRQPASPSDSNSAVPVKKRNKGGHPPRADQIDFFREVWRRGLLDGGNLSRRTLRKEMKDWSAVKMPDLDERTVERWIDDLVDVSLLAPD